MVLITEMFFYFLSIEMLPAIRNLAGDVFVFLQDSTSAHRARATVEYLRQAIPEFISQLTQRLVEVWSDVQ